VVKAKSGAAKSCGETHEGSSPSPSTIGLLFCFDVVLLPQRAVFPFEKS